VLGLAWNPTHRFGAYWANRCATDGARSHGPQSPLHGVSYHRHTLASASADHTIKLWDLQTTQALRSYTHHKDKVQTVRWNPAEPTVMLSGAYDRTAAVYDIRAPKAVASWKLTADVEATQWNPFAPQYYLVSGKHGHSIRSGSWPNATRPAFAQCGACS